MLSGVLVVNKQFGISSASVVSKIKRLLIDSKKTEHIIKVGHFGTLDPYAEGVLPIAVGRATRLFKYHLEEDKEYITRFVFGFATDTLDLEGKVVSENTVFPDIVSVKNAILTLKGKIQQLPPSFSAKSINGVRAYKLARQGLDVILSPKDIEIKEIILLEQISEKEYEFKIVCSSGTYIRSIVRDLSELLGTVGTMSYLRRERSGQFTLSQALTLEEFNVENILSQLIPLYDSVPNYNKITVEQNQYKQLRDGKKLPCYKSASRRNLLYCENNLVGICMIENDLIVPETWLV